MNTQIISRTNAVFRRTTKGQAAVSPRGLSTLDNECRRLLLLVNGFTSLGALAEICDVKSAEESARALQISGLIEEAQERRHSETLQPPWRTHERQ